MNGPTITGAGFGAFEIHRQLQPVGIGRQNADRASRRHHIRRRLRRLPIDCAMAASGQWPWHSGEFGTNCTNCFAIPKGNGTASIPSMRPWPTAPFSASQLNWTTFNVAGNSGTNGTRNEFDPPQCMAYEIARSSAIRRSSPSISV